jgi:aldose 1-epimerase
MAHQDAPHIGRGSFERLETYVLSDPRAGSTAELLPQIGNNVLSFATRAGDQTLGVIAPPTSLAAFRGHPIGYSTPVLFPYPGRVAGGRFTFRGREYQLPQNDGYGNALHGPVNCRPWTVRTEESDASGATLVSEIDTVDSPDILAEWPFPFRLTERVSLSGSVLRLSLAATNLGDAPMPMGLGLHPYFAAPVAGRGDRADNLVSISADTAWTQPRALPTGETTSLSRDEMLIPRRIREIDAKAAEDVKRSINRLYSTFSSTRGLASDAPGGISAAIRDVDQRFEIQMTTSAAFGALVLFTPPWSTDISLEPHTCTPDAFNLASRGVDAGLIVLEPGETWRAWVEFSGRAI